MERVLDMKIKKLNKKNILLLITIMILFMIIGISLAYFGWSSTEEDKNSSVDVTIVGGTGTCDKLTDNNKLLVPTSSKDNGRIITIKVSQQVSAYASITWNMLINRLNTAATTTLGLKHESFKYELVNTTTGVSYGNGNFASINDGDTITVEANEKLKMNNEYIFTLYLWIDGEWGVNPNDMQNQSYDIDMNCSIMGVE